MSNLVVVHTTAGAMQAEIIKGLFESVGIPARLSQESVGSVYGFTVGAMGLVDILVPEEHTAQAQEVLAAYERGELELEESEDEEDTPDSLR